MIYFVNIFTVLLAIIFSFVISTEKYKYRTSVGLIFLGIAFHLIEAYLNYTAGSCSNSEKENFIQAIDSCIDYQSGDMVYAQAMIIAGFTVLFVSFVIARNTNKK